MRRFTPVLVLTLAVSLSGCGLLSRFTGGNQAEEEEFETIVIPTQPAAEESDEAAAAEFEDPLVASDDGAALTANADLIKSTNPTERANQVKAKTQDPFYSVPVPPAPSKLPRPEAPGRRSEPDRSTRRPSPRLLPDPGLEPLPELPQAETANAVAVTGIVRIGSTPYAIVQAPGESDTRYVTVGQRLSNGRILVKRIDTIGGEPMVVLEENGIEVALGVGSGGEPEAGGEAAPAEDNTAAAPDQPTAVAGAIAVPPLPVVAIAGSEP